jgi:hypothetical protein
MTVQILVQPLNDQFSASLLGSPELQVIRPSKNEAIEALREALTQKVRAGEIVSIELGPIGVSGLAGRFADDPSLREICAEIYRQRDADRDS